MNQQERKYTAKRITEEEERIISAIDNAPRKTPNPDDVFDVAVGKLTSKELKQLAIDAINALSVNQTKKTIEARVDSFSRYVHGVGRVSADYGDAYLNIDFKATAGETSTVYETAKKERRAEEATRKRTIKKVKAEASKCRDKAMLGDGTAALDAFNKFVAKLDIIAEAL